MAQIESGKSSRRRTNVELNLVPFIDLMSVLITFLLITAVWTQVSMIQIGSSFYGKKTENQPPQVLPDLDKVLKLEVLTTGYILTVGRERMSIVKNTAGLYDENILMEQLKRAKQLFPNKTDGQIAIDDSLPYEYLVAGMDALLNSGFPQIGIATGGP